MGVSIWEGGKAQDLIDAVNNTKTVVDVSTKLKEALLNIARNASYIDSNGNKYVSDLAEALDELSPGGDAVKYIYASKYGSGGDNNVAGVVYRNSNDRTIIGEVSDKPYLDFKNQDESGYSGKFPLSPIHIPAGAVAVSIYIEGVESGGADRYLNGQICEYSSANNRYDIISNTSASTNNYDVSDYNNGNYYLHVWSGRSTEYGHDVVVDFSY